MNTDDKLPEMPAEVLAHCERLRACIDRLAKDLEESRKATESVQAAAEVDRAAARAAHNRLGDDYLELCGRHGRTMQALARANAEQVQLVRALRALVDGIDTFVRLYNDDDEPGPLEKMTREAKEVLSLVEAPFG